jgi:hypothetical protein
MEGDGWMDILCIIGAWRTTAMYEYQLTHKKTRLTLNEVHARSHMRENREEWISTSDKSSTMNKQRVA